MNHPASSSTANAARAARMRWWHEARFGMFVHWGLYSQLGQNEWAMNLDRIPVSEYEPLADSWQSRVEAGSVEIAPPTAFDKAR